MNLEKINLLQRQLDDQTGQFNRIISEYDKKVVEHLEKIPQVRFVLK